MPVDSANKQEDISELRSNVYHQTLNVPNSAPVESVELSSTKTINIETPESKVTPPKTAKASLLQRASALAQRHCRLALACSLSLLLGCGLSYFCIGGQVPQAVEVQEPSVPTKTYFASITHRNEPIQPLIPFEGLDPQLVELGRRLFHEPALSNNGRISCVSCHSLAPTADKVVPVGVNGEASRQDVPTILNVGYNLAHFWDGRAGTLEDQLEHPITNPKMLGSNWDRVIKYLSDEQSYNRDFKQCFNGQATAERVQSAMAAFERSLVTPDSKLDQWLAGDEDALSSDEFGGYFLFKKYNCIACHQGAAVGGSMFQRLGVAKPYFNKSPSAADLGRFNVTKRDKDRFVFRVPSLRNVELTAPYFHDGSVDTLELAVAKMLEFQCGEEVNQEDVRRIIAFLKALNGKLPQTLK